MQNGELILAEAFCTNNNINISFINLLGEYGLVELALVEETCYIPEHQVARVEQLMRLHYELEINFEGLDVVSNLLEKVQQLHNEINYLKSRLSIYETGQ